MQTCIDALGIGEKDHHYVDAEVNDETRQKRPRSVSYITQNKAAGDAPCAAVGAGAVGEGEERVYLGMSDWVGVVTKRTPRGKCGAATIQRWPLTFKAKICYNVHFKTI
jgi:hypothetical protein